jgi:transposase
VVLDPGRMKIEALCLLASVSKDRGLVHWAIFERSVNTEKFNYYLEELKQKTRGYKASLFLDNLRVHHANLVRQKMEELEIGSIFNVAYRPEYNAIEHYWSLIKAKFKKLRLRALLDGEQRSGEELIEAAIWSIDNSIVIKICGDMIEKLSEL